MGPQIKGVSSAQSHLREETGGTGEITGAGDGRDRGITPKTLAFTPAAMA
jgi:hypothetical protein